MRNILIIGANGFTGRQLLKDLSAHKQYNVTGCSLHSDIFPALAVSYTHLTLPTKLEV